MHSGLQKFFEGRYSLTNNVKSLLIMLLKIPIPKWDKKFWEPNFVILNHSGHELPKKHACPTFKEILLNLRKFFTANLRNSRQWEMKALAVTLGQLGWKPKFQQNSLIKYCQTFLRSINCTWLDQEGWGEIF
jgi:hypothetical protein